METIGIICVISACVAGGIAAYRDVVSMTIPNICSVAVLIFWGIAAAAGWHQAVPVAGHIIVGVSVFVVSLLFYVLKIWGGGDSKLAAAFGFWFTPIQAVSFLFFMSVYGGILALSAIVLKKSMKNSTWAAKYNEKHWLGRMRDGKPVIPYGVAITAAAIQVLIPDLIKTFS